MVNYFMKKLFALCQISVTLISLDSASNTFIDFQCLKVTYHFGELSKHSSSKWKCLQLSTKEKLASSIAMEESE
mgnify:CR=1 FL=1